MRYLVFLLLFGCSSSNNSDPLIFPNDQDASVEDATIEAADTSTLMDSSYNPCVRMTERSTQYMRLLGRYCIDSNGSSWHKDFWDTQLQLACRWNYASDQKIRCLPENELSSPIYADPSCFRNSIAPVEMVNQKPVMPYVGLYHYDDAGMMDYIDIFGISDPWDGQTMYHDELYGDWYCKPFYFHFPGTQMYYVDAAVDAEIFVEQ
jgi:hypothetical protein